jgi:hypothetical protein
LEIAEYSAYWRALAGCCRQHFFVKEPRKSLTQEMRLSLEMGTLPDAALSWNHRTDYGACL